MSVISFINEWRIVMDSINNVYGNASSSDIDDILKGYSKYAVSINDMVATPWKGFKELVLVDKVKECEEIISFYFKAKDGKKLVKQMAGQYLPLKIVSDDEKYNGQIRTYTLSMMPSSDIYRISVKRVPNGLVSNYLHDSLKVGDTIEAMVPAGLFTMKDNDKKKVLISAGIGITPLISMLYDNMNKNKDITFIQAVQNSDIQPFSGDVKNICEANGFKSVVFYSDPKTSDVLGENYDEKGFVTKEWIEKNLDLDSDFYFCGPPIFMKNVNRALLSLGVSKEFINFEFFGPAEDME